jgi:hypothetical protein
VDKATIIKLVAGTLARGILWACAAIAAKAGVETISENAVQGVALFAAALIVALGSALWSKWKDKKLLTTPPPE